MSNALPAPTPAPGVTTASQWKNQVKAHPVQVPSGNTCLMRKVGLQVFVSQGMIPNSLMPIVQAAITKGQPPSQKDLEKLPSETLMNDMIDLIDKVTLFCVMEPRVHSVPIDDNRQIIPIGDPRRHSDVLYVDEVDLEDKMFIFNVAVGGTTDLERFRQESSAHVEAVPGREDVVN